MFKYEEFGLVNTSAMFKQAYAGGYAVPAFNFVCLEQLLAIVDACIETNSPCIVQASAKVRRYLGGRVVQRLAQAAVETLRDAGCRSPLALNLDHGLTYQDCVACVDSGFSSVMIDGSALPYEDNIALTKSVVEYAHPRGVAVEGELGALAGVEESVKHSDSRFTDPAAVEDFVKRSGVDSLAVSVGSSHGVVKIFANPDGSLPELRFDLLEDIARRLPGFPLVLHGASAIDPRHVAMLNRFGGDLKESQGIPEDQVRRAARGAVCKVNVASDGWLAASAATRKALAEHPDAIDPRVFLAQAREEIKQVYLHKIREVFHSAGR